MNRICNAPGAPEHMPVRDVLDTLTSEGAGACRTCYPAAAPGVAVAARFPTPWRVDVPPRVSPKHHWAPLCILDAGGRFVIGGRAGEVDRPLLERIVRAVNAQGQGWANHPEPFAATEFVQP